MFDCPPHSHTSPTSRSETDVWASSAPDTASVMGSLEAARARRVSANDPSFAAEALAVAPPSVP